MSWSRCPTATSASRKFSNRGGNQSYMQYPPSPKASRTSANAFTQRSYSQGACSNYYTSKSVPDGPARPFTSSRSRREAKSSNPRRRALTLRLLTAIEKGDTKLSRRLVYAGADLNFASCKSSTPLIHAVAQQNWEVISLLLNRGANVNAKNCDGYTALHMAAYYDTRGRILSCLIGAGAALDVKSRTGSTPLHVAAECGNVVGVRTLLNSGAKKFVRDSSGKTPFAVSKRLVVKNLLRKARMTKRYPSDLGFPVNKKSYVTKGSY